MLSDSYTVQKIDDNDWPVVIPLVEQVLKNSMLGWLGHGFAGIFYRALAALDYCCVYGAYDESGTLAGVIFGTLDQGRAYSHVMHKNRFKLLLAANIRLLRWSVMKWLISGVRQKLTAEKKPEQMDDIRARLLVISVLPEFQGKGIAQRLIAEMERWFVRNNVDGPYVIYTEQSNHQANRFYEKIGASLEDTHCHHGRFINRWHKSLKLIQAEQ